MKLNDLANEIRQTILSTRTTEELDAARPLTANRLDELEAEIAYIYALRERWASFQIERLTGGTVYELPPPVVTWVEKALPKHEAERVFLDCVHVVEWADKLWLMGADGYRLNACAIDADIPAGLYYAADNMIVPAAGIGGHKSYTEIITRESSKLLLPTPATGEWEGMSYCAWGLNSDGTLTEREFANCGYFVDRRFYDEACSFSQEPPTYGLLRGWSNALHMFWGGTALAIIKPMQAPKMQA